MWACVHFPSSYWDVIRPRPVWVPHMLPYSVWVHMCTGPAVFRRPRFFGVLHPLWLLKSFHPSSSLEGFPEPQWRGFDGDIPFRTSVPLSLSLCIQLHCSVFGPIYCRREGNPVLNFHRMCFLSQREHLGGSEPFLCLSSPLALWSDTQQFSAKTRRHIICVVGGWCVFS